MDNKPTNRELANAELSQDINNGIISLTPILPVSAPDIPNIEEINSENSGSNSNVNNYTVNVNVSSNQKPANIQNTTNTIVKNVVESKKNQSPQELKKNSQTNLTENGIRDSNLDFSFDNVNIQTSNNNIFDNFFETQNTFYNTKGGIDNTNIFSSDSESNSFYTKSNETIPHLLEMPPVMQNLASSEENQFLTQNDIKENFINNNDNTRYITEESNNFSSDNSQTNTIMPSMLSDFSIPEFNQENQPLYSQNNYIQKEANIIKQNIDGNSNTFIDNTSSMNNFLNTNNVTNNLMNNLFTNNKFSYNETISNNSQLTELNKSNLNIIKETNEIDNIFNQSMDRSVTTNSENNYIQKLQNEQIHENHQKRTNKIDGIDGMNISEMNGDANDNVVLNQTIVPISKNFNIEQKFKHLNPTPSTISLFFGKMNSPPIWRTEHA